MSNSPPSDRQSSDKSPIEFDDWIGILVAFTTIGTILAWSFSQMDRGGNFISLPLTSTSSTSPTSSTSINGDRTLELSQEEIAALESIPESLETAVTPPFLTTLKPKTKTQRQILPFIGRLGSTTTDKSTSDLAKTPDTDETADVDTPVPTAETETPNITEETPDADTPVPRTEMEAPNTTEETPAVEAQTPDADTPSTINFSDVPENFWARPFIVGLVERGLFDGVRQGTFQPNKTMTRAEFAVEVQKAFDPSPSRNQLNYRDVEGDRPNAEAIDWATETGFLRGYPGQVFQPDQPITRSQVLVSLVSGLGLNPPPDTNSTIKRYEDANKIPKYGIGPVAAATQAGLVVNYPKLELFNPEKGATRAEVASFLYQALAKQGKVDKIPSEYIVQPN